MAKKVVILEATVDTGASAESLIKVKKGVDDLNKSVKELTGVEKSFDDLNKKISAGGMSFREMSKAVKEYQTIALQAGEESPVGKQALENAGQLKDRLGDLSAKVNNLAKDGRGLQTALQLSSTVVAGYQAFQGVTAMLGVENEAMLEAITKLTAAQGVLSGIEQIHNALQQESLLMLKLQNIQLELKTKGLKKVALELLKNPWTIALVGVAALVAGIGYLVTRESEYSKAVRLSKESTEALIIELDKRLKKAVRAYDQEIALLRASGKETFEVEIKKQEYIQQTSAVQLKLLRRTRAIQEKMFNAELEEMRAKGGVFEAIAELALEKSKDKDSEIFKSRKELDDKITEMEDANADSTNALEVLKATHEKERNDKAIKSHDDFLKKKEDDRKRWADIAEKERQADLDAQLKSEQAYEEMKAQQTAMFDKLREEEFKNSLKRNEENKAIIDEEALARSEEIRHNTEAFKMMVAEQQLEYDRSLMERGLITKEQFNQLELKLEDDKRQKKIEIADKTLNAISSLETSLFEITNNLGRQDEKSKLARAKRQFQITKGLNMSEVGINTAKAISSASTLVPPANIPAMIFAGITGAAQIAAIASKQFEGGGSSAPPSVPSASGASGEGGTQSVVRGADNTTLTAGLVGQGNNASQREVIVLQSDNMTAQQKELKQIELRSSI